MNEDIISRLKMAEEEAAKLRKELAASQLDMVRVG